MKRSMAAAHATRLGRAFVILAVVAGTACAQTPERRTQPRGGVIVASAGGRVGLGETGTEERGIPRSTHRQFTPAEQEVLRMAFGVDDPNGLYLSDSSDAALLKFDPNTKSCRSCYVDSYRVG